MNNIKKQEKVFHDAKYKDCIEINKATKYYCAVKKMYEYFIRRVTQVINGARVLEYGCGTGGFTDLWEKNGAIITGIDISSEAINIANKEAVKKKMKAKFYEMDAENLDFENNSFDVIVGGAILHHLNLDKSYKEISRVLKKNGHAIFYEPLGHNFFINLFRKFTPSMRTKDEHPLLMKDIKSAKKYFKNVDCKFFRIFTLLVIPFRNTFLFNRLSKILFRIDELFMFMFPFIRRFAWIVVMDFCNASKQIDSKAF